MRAMTADEDLECSICYKAIGKIFTACVDPCNKVFHNSCLERIMEKTKEAAYEEGRVAEHKCCYCRRSIDMPYYNLLRMERHLRTLGRNCYSVYDALKRVHFEMKRTNHEENIVYEVYELRDIYHEKKPKQAKRAQIQKQTRSPRVHIRQNIGGRKR